MNRLGLLIIILVVLLIYLSFSCYESFAEIKDEMVTIYKDKSSDFKISRNNKTNTFNLKSNIQVDGDFGVNGKLNVAGKDFDSILNNKLSPYVNENSLEQKLKELSPNRECLLRTELDTKLGNYVSNDSLDSKLSGYAPIDDYMTVDVMNNVLREGISVNKNKSICIDDLCLTYEDISKIKSTNTA